MYPNPHQAQTVGLRAATPDDRSFLLALFASTRTDELAALAWDAAQSQLFIQMQFDARERDYNATHPAAEDNIVLLGEQPIGRILVDKLVEEFMFLDIALLPEHRNAGIGSTLIQNLLSEAAAEGKPVRMHVINFNPAVRLYQRLGFSTIGGDGVYLEMKSTI